MKKLMLVTLVFTILFGMLISCESESITAQEELYENTFDNSKKSATDKPKIKRPGG